MICADFLAGANLENEDSNVLLQSALRFFKFLPRRRAADISAPRDREGVMTRVRPKSSLPEAKLTTSTTVSAPKCCVATVGDASSAERCPTLRFTIRTFEVTRVMIRRKT